ncbi:MAG: GIY-YIG nuclease family protein [Bacteroidia bacterium]|nr:GIY-YIG nuclease family protein [Bacteroidia bacterium]
MFYVYILYSEKVNRYYVGYSENPEKRLEERHNKGAVKATKGGIPYVIKSKKLFSSEIEAIQEESRIKRMKSRKYIESLINGNW